MRSFSSFVKPQKVVGELGSRRKRSMPQKVQKAPTIRNS